MNRVILPITILINCFYLTACGGGSAPADNRAPVADAGNDLRVDANSLVTLDGSASHDPDNDEIDFKWLQISGPVTQLSSDTDDTPSFIAPDTDTILQYQLIATDGRDSSVPDAITITVSSNADDNDSGTDTNSDSTDDTTDSSGGSSGNSSGNSSDNSSDSSSDNSSGSSQDGSSDNSSGSSSNDSSNDNSSNTGNDTSGDSGNDSGTNNDDENSNNSNDSDTNDSNDGNSSDGDSNSSNSGGSSNDDQPAEEDPVNISPAANAGTDATINGLDLYTLDGTASNDPEGNPLTYLWNQTDGTSVTLDDNNASQASFTAPNINDTLTFSLIVNDGEQDSPIDSVSITIMQVNTAPTAHAGGNSTADGEEIVTLDASGSSDPEGDTLSYQWSQTAGTGVSLNNANIEFPSFIAPNIDDSLTFSLVVSDGNLDSVASTVTIEISEVNKSPIASAGVDLVANANDTVTLDGNSSSDPNGDNLSFLWQQISGETVSLENSNSATPYFIAPESGGLLTFSLTVSDGELTSEPDSIQIDITASDPALNSDAGENQQVNSNDIVTLDGSASSADSGATLSYTWRQTGGPSVTLSSANSATPSFTAPEAPSNSALTLVFTLVVSDGNTNSAADSTIIVIDDRNTAPIADAGLSRTVEGNGTVSLDGTLSSDPDGDPISYQWVQTQGERISLLFADTATPEFVAPRDGGEFQFSLTVNDGELDSNEAVVNITALPANNPPIANAGVDRYVGSLSIVALKGERSSDPDGDTISYLWTQTEGPTISLSSTTVANPTFEAHTDGQLVFSLVVNDGRLDSSPDTINVTVGPIPATNIKVNGTGITWGANYPIGNNLDCSGEAVEHQDCSLGRELTHNDDSDGRAGFSFTKIDSDGVTTDHSNPEWACVQDEITGLMWETKTGGNDVIGDEGLNDADDTYSWYNSDASSNGGAEGFPDSKANVCFEYDEESSNSFCNTQAFVNRMNEAGWCGYADWRLPTRKELLSIVDYGNNAPMLDNDYFPSNASLTWTSTPFAIGTTSAWGVNFDHGNSFSLDKRNANQIRLVRGGYEYE